MEPNMELNFDVLRAKARAGELTMDEMREAIKAMRAGRAAATTKAKAKGTSKKVIDSNAMLGELEGL